MNILVYGIGAMGSIYATLLSKAGNNVYVVDKWQDHIKAIKEKGLKVEGASGNNLVTNLVASHLVPQNIIFDLIIVSTKASGVGSAGFDIKNIINNDTFVLTIQNGLGSSDEIINYIPKSNILLGVADGFGASIIEPGHIHHNSMKLIRIGEFSGGISKRLKLIEAIWTDAGFNVKAYGDINQLIWEKFICNVTFSAPCTVYNCTVGELMKSEQLWRVAIGCTKEAYQIARLKDVPLSFNDPIKYVKDFGKKMPNAKPSMLLDHLSKRKSEIDFINGRVEMMGKELDIETPYNFMLSTIVRRKEEKFL